MRRNLAFHLTLLLIPLLGLLTLFSVAPNKVPQQATFTLFGFLAYLYLSRQDPAIYKNLGPAFYLLSLLLLTATFIFGKDVRGAVRWINLGSFRLQTSELAKPLLIVGYANFLSRWQPFNLRHLFINLFLALLPISLIFFQPDLGTAVVHLIIWFSMVFVAGIPLLAVLLATFIPPFLFKLAPHFLQDYQLKRLTTFLNPTQDPLGAGYNVIQATIAIGSGGIFGKGLGRGTQSRLRFLPERHTDFIFASLAEEFGLLGAAALILLFTFFLFKIFTFLTHHQDFTSKLILTGTFTYLFLQTFLNIAMNLGIAPVTGVTLPLVSYGGSSIIATYLALGIAVSTTNELHPQASLEIK